ncbi:MAG: SDR family oxidoreductase [Alphaproteobacteria bacterium]
MASLARKTLFITGATRGIGHAIGLRAAQDGANIVIAAKSVEPHPKLPGTIFTAAEDMARVGGQALAVQCDIRDENQIRAAVDKAVEQFGGIDICVNNASAISLTDTPSTLMKRYDLMHSINSRGTFATTQACLPHLQKAENPHVLTLASSINLNPKWFENHTAYTMAKYGMSMCVLGHAAEFKKYGIAVNGLWPKTLIATAALRLLPGVDAETARKPEIVADAAHEILTRDSKTCTGNFFIDEDVLKEGGVTDLSKYAVNPGKRLTPDIFLD